MNKKFGDTIFIITIILFLSFSGHSQFVFNRTLSENDIEKCNNVLSNLTIRGFQFGMTAAEVKKIYPEIKIPYADVAGFSDTDLIFITDEVSLFKQLSNNVIKKGKYEDLDGLKAMSLVFVNYKLIQLYFHYDPDVEWNGTSEFSRAISEKLNLPFTWSIGSKGNLMFAKMDCERFGIFAGIFKSEDGLSSPIMSILDIETEEAAIESANQQADKWSKFSEDFIYNWNEEKKKKFKPE